jgi:hypothetical protein
MWVSGALLRLLRRARRELWMKAYAAYATRALFCGVGAFELRLASCTPDAEDQICLLPLDPPCICKPCAAEKSEEICGHVCVACDVNAAW